MASVRLGGTRLFLSGGEETLIRVHQVQIFFADICLEGKYLTVQYLRPFACLRIPSTKNNKNAQKLFHPQMTRKSSLKEVAVLRGHLSNIRSLTVLPLSAGSLRRKTSTPNNLTKKNEEESFSSSSPSESMQEICKETTEALVISGGGRAELRLWHLALQNGRVTNYQIENNRILTSIPNPRRCVDEAACL